MQRRTFLTKAALAATATSTALLAACGKKESGEVGAPAVSTAKKTAIKWRLQTYAGPALAEHVIKPSIDAFNKAANGEMVIELYFADQLVPTGELFRAMQAGTIDAVQSDDDSMSAPVDIRVFGGYFPFATRFSLDVPALFHKWGLNEVWAEASLPRKVWYSDSVISARERRDSRSNSGSRSRAVPLRRTSSNAMRRPRPLSR